MIFFTYLSFPRLWISSVCFAKITPMFALIRLNICIKCHAQLCVIDILYGKVISESPVVLLLLCSDCVCISWICHFGCLSQTIVLVSHSVSFPSHHFFFFIAMYCLHCYLVGLSIQIWRAHNSRLHKTLLQMILKLFLIVHFQIMCHMIKLK